MVGLLDIFGTGGGDTLSLLGMSPEAIQRSRDDAQAQALYGLAGSLLSGGPTGLSIVRGLQQGSQAYKNAMQGQLQEQFQGFQLQDALRKRKLEEQALARQQMIDRAVAGSYQPAQAAAPAQFYGQETQMPLMDDEGQMMPGATAPVAGRAAGLDFQTLMPILQASPEGRKTLADLMASQKAMRPEYKEVGGVLYEIPTFGGEIKPVAGTKKRETVTVGNVVLDKDNMQVLYTAPDAPSSSIREFQDFARLSPQDQRAYLSLQENKRPSTTIHMPNEGERKSAVLANRMNFSVAQMNEAIGQDPKAAMPNTAAEAARYFARSDFLANKLTPEQRQVVETAQLDVLDAALTLGTGAAYTREQLEGYRRSYFPQLGDEKKTVDMKQKRLENLLRSAEIASGRAASSIPTKMPQPFEIPQSTGMEIPANVTVRKR
jgi:hypothetical protein